MCENLCLLLDARAVTLSCVLPGVAYAFLTADGGLTWSEVQRLVPSDAASGDLFGQSVSADGGSLAVGAIGDDG